MNKQNYLEREYLANITTLKNGEKAEKEIKFLAYTKEDAEQRILDTLNKKLKSTKARLNDGEITAKIKANKITISKIRARPSYMLCGECRYFESNENGLEYVGICKKGKVQTTNLSNCKFKIYYNNWQYIKGNNRTCEFCGVRLKNNQKKYCSKNCGVKARRQQKILEEIKNATK